MSHNKEMVLTFRMMDPRNAYYMGTDPRRRIDERNGNLINEDKTAFANMPSKGFQAYFPGRPWNDNRGY